MDNEKKQDYNKAYSQYTEVIKLYNKLQNLSSNQEAIISYRNMEIEFQARADAISKWVTKKEKKIQAEYLPEEWLQKGLNYSKNGEYKELIAYCQHALDTGGPNYIQAWHLMAKAYIGLNDLSMGIRCYSKVVEINPDLKEVWNAIGNTFLQMKLHREAINCCDTALAIDNTYATAWNTKGTSYIYLGEFRDAIICFDKTIGLDPHIKLAWSNKANAHLMLKDFQEAFNTIDRALSFDPENEFAWMAKGVMKKMVNRYQEAIQCFDRVIEIDPNTIEAHDERAYCLDKIRIN